MAEKKRFWGCSTVPVKYGPSRNSTRHSVPTCLDGGRGVGHFYSFVGTVSPNRGLIGLLTTYLQSPRVIAAAVEFEARHDES